MSTATSFATSTPPRLDGFLEREPERLLIERAQLGDRDARDQLVAAHLRLVASIARRSPLRGTTLEDAVHEGVLGLLEAIDRFDVARENRFSTYASYWVLDRIRRHARSARGMVAAPSTRSARVILRGHARAVRLLERRLGRLPTRAEIAAQLGVSDAELASCEPALTGTDVALDAFETGDPRGSVASDALSPEDAFADAELAADTSRRVAVALAALGPRERLIVERRFLEDEETSLADLGSSLGVSRERARQIQEIARAKLKRALAA